MNATVLELLLLMMKYHDQKQVGKEKVYLA